MLSIEEMVATIFHKAQDYFGFAPVPIVPNACPEPIEGFNRCAPFKPLSRETDKIPLLRNARSAPLFALAFRGKKTLRSVRAQLYDHPRRF